MEWQTIYPDKNNDWLNQRNIEYENYTSIAGNLDSVFNVNAVGISTNRDIWAYGFSRKNETND